jgi:NADPH2:quinone reductase
MPQSALKFASEGDSNTMRAWTVEAPGEGIKLRTVHIPEPKPHQVRVRVVASCTNPVDKKRLDMPTDLAAFPAVSGCDAAGIIDAIGDDVTTFKVGDRVHYFSCPFTEFGSWAEFAVVEEFNLVRVPDTMTWDIAAASPCAGWTAYECLFDRLRIERGNTIFVSSGTGGVGHLAIQMAKHVGLTVITTASGEYVERLRRDGYVAIDYTTQDVKEEVMKITNGKGVDYVLDMLGPEEAKTSQEIIKFGGQLVHIAMSVPPLEGGGNFFNAITVHHVFIPGYTVRPEAAAKFVAIGHAVNVLLQTEAIRINISEIYSFEQVDEALKAQAEGRVKGKLLISIASDPAVLKTTDFKFE